MINYLMSDRQAELTEIQNRVNRDIAEITTSVNNIYTEGIITEEQKNTFLSEIGRYQADHAREILDKKGSVKDRYYATPGEMDQLKAQEKALQPHFRALLASWNNLLTQNAQNMINESDKFNDHYFQMLLEEKHRTAKSIYKLEALPGTAFDSNSFESFDKAFVSLKNYAVARYQNKRNYTNYFRAGASRATKLMNALAFYDRMILPNTGDELNRNGLTGVTHGTLGGVVTSCIEQMNKFKMMFQNRILAKNHAATTVPVLVSRGVFFENTQQNIQQTPLDCLKSVVEERKTFLEAFKTIFAQKFSDGTDFRFKKSTQLVLADHQRDVDINTPRQDYLHDKEHFYIQSANVILAFQPSRWASSGLPDHLIQQNEVTGFVACLEKLSEILKYTGASLCYDANKNEDLAWVCDQQIAFYKERCKVQNIPEMPKILDGMQALQVFIEERYKESQGRFAIQKDSAHMKIKLAMKCLRLLVMKGDIPADMLDKKDIKILADDTGRLAKVLRSIENPAISEKDAKDFYQRILEQRNKDERRNTSILNY